MGFTFRQSIRIQHRCHLCIDYDLKGTFLYPILFKGTLIALNICTKLFRSCVSESSLVRDSAQMEDMGLSGYGLA